MNNQFTLLDFDTNLFGYNVAKINSQIDQLSLKEVLQKLRKKSIKLAYLFTSPSDKKLNTLADKYGGKRVEERLHFSKKISNVRKKNEPNIHSYLHKPLSDSLRSLAFQSGHVSRYRIDKNFKKNEFKKLYTIWIKKSLKGKIAIDVLVYCDEEGEKGLITLEKKNNTGIIGILAVDSKFRKQSIGKKLVKSAVLTFQAKGYNYVTVTTQNENEAAKKFYKKLGFSVKKREYIYHFWL